MAEANFHQLSRRIAGWATNGLATAIVLVIGLGFGRQIALWWHEPAVVTSAAASSQFSNAKRSGLRQLEFGNAAARLHVETVSGDKSAALAKLREVVRQIAKQATVSDRTSGPAERKLLDELAATKPVEQGAAYRMDEIDDVLPTVVCSTAMDPRTKNGPSRILALGFALPSDAGWSLYGFEFSSESLATANPATEPSTIPLPPGSRRSLSLGQPNGETIVAFHGPGDGGSWEQFFRAELARQGWQLQGEWRSLHVSRAARYSKEADSTKGKIARWLDIQFAPDDRQQLSGTAVISLTP